MEVGVKGAPAKSSVNRGSRLKDKRVRETQSGRSALPVPWLLGQGVLERPFLQPLDAVGPVGGGHAAVRVQQDPEAADYQQPQEDQQHPHEGKRRLLLQSQSVRHRLVPVHGSERVVEVQAAHGEATSRSLRSRLTCYLDTGDTGNTGDTGDTGDTGVSD